ncbi:MAG: TIGR03067 domain-containing protein [Gemmataceae bacterium]
MRRIIPFLALSSLAFAPLPFPKPDPAKDDLRKLQGEWVRVSCTIDGEAGREDPGSVKVKIDGSMMAFGSPGDTWGITLDGRKEPKHIDSRNTVRKGADSVFLGIYRLEGDTLTICWRNTVAGGVRPAGFNPHEPRVWLHTYTRKRP